LLFIFDEAARNNHHQWQNPLFHHSWGHLSPRMESPQNQTWTNEEHETSNPSTFLNELLTINGH
jgi:hypothetical protein